MLSQLTTIFGSKTKAQEILLLLKDAKEVVRQGFYGSELQKVEQSCKESGLFLAKSKFKVLPAERHDEYSNLGIRIATDDPRSEMFFVYFSKDERKALLASYAELMNRPRELGILLGYPECCINYFCHNFRSENPNPQHSPTNFLTNLSLRHKDYALLSHFPCHSECEESKRLAQKYFQVIEQADSEWAGELKAQLGKDLEK